MTPSIIPLMVHISALHRVINLLEVAVLYVKLHVLFYLQGRSNLGEPGTYLVRVISIQALLSDF